MEKQIIIFLSLLIVYRIVDVWQDVNKRYNFVLQDYSRNILAGLPKNSILVLKKDVQIFSQWYRWYVEKKRMDVIPVAQGLSGSLWYKNQMYRAMAMGSCSDVYFTALTDKNGFSEFILRNKLPVFFATNTDVPTDFTTFTLNPYGLVVSTININVENTSDRICNELYVYRIKYYYDAWREFFTPDIIEDYANGYSLMGMSYLKLNDCKLSRKYLFSTIYFDPNFGLGYEGLGYSYFSFNDYNNAILYYTRGKKVYETMYTKAIKYKSNEDIKFTVLTNWARIVNNLGVVYERRNENDKALNIFDEILNKIPTNIDALYNKFVVYYKLKDMSSARDMVRKIHYIDPNNVRIKPYLWLLKT